MEYGNVSKRPLQPLNPQIRSEATEWLLRFSEAEVDAAAREDFNHWLRTSPEHVRAYLRVSAFWQEAGRIDGGRAARDIDALVARARSEANVFPLAFGPHNTESTAGHASPLASQPGTRYFFPRGRRLVGIAAAIAVAVVGTVATYQHLTRDIYETRIGEQRTVNLPDGSTLALNADSRVRVRYSDTERIIELDEGQALFKVAKSPARPFIVRSGDASVRAVGTKFDVYRKTTGVTVTVVEGKVAVTAEKLRRQEPTDAARSGSAPTVGPSGNDTSAPVLLAAGEQVVIPKIAMAVAAGQNVGDTIREPEVRSIKIEEATAWTEGLLVFDGAPLADVVQEFNRQNLKRLVIDNDPELSELRISGTFPSSGSQRITRFLQERFGVVVHETDDDIKLSRP